MDFSKFDSRTRAEAGAPMTVLDPLTDEQVIDDKTKDACRVIVRGTASKSMQEMMRARQKAAMAARPKDGEESEEARVMEDLHMDLCAGAAPFIVGFENIERDGRPLEATEDDIKWFLDLSFPEMGAKTDEHGEVIMRESKDEDGKTVRSPEFEMKNNPFAKQIGEFAGRQKNFMGNGSGD